MPQHPALEREKELLRGAVPVHTGGRSVVVLATPRLREDSVLLLGQQQTSTAKQLRLEWGGTVALKSLDFGPILPKCPITHVPIPGVGHSFYFTG